MYDSMAAVTRAKHCALAIAVQRLNIRRATTCVCHHWPRFGPHVTRHYSTPAADQQSTDPQTAERPVKYTTSDANVKHRAYQNWRATDEEIAEWSPPYERPIIIGSFAIFLLYFCILREENDIDKLLGQSLFETVPELEQPMIEVHLKHFKKYNMDTTQLEQRLEELRQLKSGADETARQSGAR